jgi:hypothetical protein
MSGTEARAEMIVHEGKRFVSINDLRKALARLAGGRDPHLAEIIGRMILVGVTERKPQHQTAAIVIAQFLVHTTGLEAEIGNARN